VLCSEWSERKGTRTQPRLSSWLIPTLLGTVARGGRRRTRPRPLRPRLPQEPTAICSIPAQPAISLRRALCAPSCSYSQKLANVYQDVPISAVHLWSSWPRPWVFIRPLKRPRACRTTLRFLACASSRAWSRWPATFGKRTSFICSTSVLSRLGPPGSIIRHPLDSHRNFLFTGFLLGLRSSPLRKPG